MVKARLVVFLMDQRPYLKASMNKKGLVATYCLNEALLHISIARSAFQSLDRLYIFWVACCQKNETTGNLCLHFQIFGTENFDDI